ncbi:hypothetical protein LCGC14_1470100 [marine sediment metagenome]|uniref:Uncharacterized protein n=1 Tax=marine sediment metagenome TaxID=412755 RepID=A0A0F9JD91_9ZZZZ
MADTAVQKTGALPKTGKPTNSFYGIKDTTIGIIATVFVVGAVLAYTIPRF